MDLLLTSWIGSMTVNKVKVDNNIIWKTWGCCCSNNHPSCLSLVSVFLEGRWIIVAQVQPCQLSSHHSPISLIRLTSSSIQISAFFCFFFFHIFDSEILEKFNKNLAKLVESTLKKVFFPNKILNSLLKNGKISREEYTLMIQIQLHCFHYFSHIVYDEGELWMSNRFWLSLWHPVVQSTQVE